MTVLICGSPASGFQIIGLFANSADALSGLAIVFGQPPSQPRALARTLVRGRAGTAVFSVTSERALGPFGKRLRRYVPRRIVRRRHLCASVKCRMNARH